MPFDWRTIGLARRIPHRKEGTNLSFLKFSRRRRAQELASDEDSTALQNWVIQTLAKEMRFVKNPSIATRRDLGLIAALARRLPEELLENGQKTASKSRAAKCFYGRWQSRNHASLSPCAFGMPGESAWPGQSSDGSTASRSNGASQDSFSPVPAALP